MSLIPRPCSPADPLPSAPARARSALAGATSKCVGLLAVGLLATAPAMAGYIGHEVQAQYYFPNLSTVFLDSGTAVAGAGQEFDNIAGWSEQDVDFSDTNIRLTYALGWSLADRAGASFDGWVFSDRDAADIIGVSLESTNLAGLSSANLSFNGSQVFLNTLGLGAWGPNTFVSIDVQFADAVAVPEPTALSLVGLALLSLAAARRPSNRRPMGATSHPTGA
ncbi:hypothetical protein [Aquabacterium sp.]|uniref:hypothetical protein n=1 Tax=Aquabacterium sp. TaxID=1872578 RepID=UPI002BA41C95|nr:hypothetical protein [Aquabacterium sp.]HSW03909.1 hypothetical protein [Aquabacterium sp.]